MPVSNDPTDSGGKKLARSLSRGLDKLDFLPAVILVVVFFGGVIGWEFLKKWNPRDPADFARQFEVLEKSLQNSEESAGVKVRVPGRDAWQVRSFGDVDEWKGSYWVWTSEKPGEEIEKPVVMEFNMKLRGLEPLRR